MRALTQEVKKDIITNFHSEMLGFQDKTWRERYADYFLPESAVTQMSLSSTNITSGPLSQGSILVATTTTFTPGTVEMLDIRKSGDTMGMPKLSQHTPDQTTKWSKLDTKWRAFIVLFVLLLIGGLVTAVSLLYIFRIQKKF